MLKQVLISTTFITMLMINPIMMVPGLVSGPVANLDPNPTREIEIGRSF
jgi:hypothetical protein